jgi:hypothetical protein
MHVKYVPVSIVISLIICCTYMSIGQNYKYQTVASSNPHYSLGNQLFVKRSRYIRIQNPIHNHSEGASKQDVLELTTLWYATNKVKKKST